jgi:hypothetical protein
MNKTAVEWLVEQLDTLIEYYPSQFEQVNKAFEQAKAMEKEQISEAYRTGVEEDVYLRPLRTGEQYYNETFN